MHSLVGSRCGRGATPPAWARILPPVGDSRFFRRPPAELQELPLALRRTCELGAAGALRVDDVASFMEHGAAAWDDPSTPGTRAHAAEVMREAGWSEERPLAWDRLRFTVQMHVGYAPPVLEWVASIGELARACGFDHVEEVGAGLGTLGRAARELGLSWRCTDIAPAADGVIEADWNDVVGKADGFVVVILPPYTHTAISIEPLLVERGAAGLVYTDGGLTSGGRPSWYRRAFDLTSLTRPDDATHTIATCAGGFRDFIDPPSWLDEQGRSILVADRATIERAARSWKPPRLQQAHGLPPARGAVEAPPAGTGTPAAGLHRPDRLDAHHRRAGGSG